MEHVRNVITATASHVIRSACPGRVAMATCVQMPAKGTAPDRTEASAATYTTMANTGSLLTYAMVVVEYIPHAAYIPHM